MTPEISHAITIGLIVTFVVVWLGYLARLTKKNLKRRIER